ncbi:uncharacterized protein P884DRAFT_254822 [Thermothelomyces heterothallicus CBS 202.75]|uniref:uncharacterized protein n=1 Tax=Thermothelomyces heterothallicus CBS 202.75 TaxID=1149848 RepID=UPI00374275F2
MRGSILLFFTLHLCASFLPIGCLLTWKDAPLVCTDYSLHGLKRRAVLVSIELVHHFAALCHPGINTD